MKARERLVVRRGVQAYVGRGPRSICSRAPRRCGTGHSALQIDGQGDAGAAPAGLTRSTASTACLLAGMIVRAGVNRRVLVGAAGAQSSRLNSPSITCPWRGGVVDWCEWTILVSMNRTISARRSGGIRQPKPIASVRKPGVNRSAPATSRRIPLDDRHRWNLADLHASAHLQDRRESLGANECGAGDRGQHHETDGGDRADDPADFKQQVDLDKRHRDEQQEEHVKDFHPRTPTSNVRPRPNIHGTGSAMTTRRGPIIAAALGAGALYGGAPMSATPDRR